MAQDGMTIRLHLKRMKVVRVVEDEIDKLVVEVADTRTVVRCPACGPRRSTRRARWSCATSPGTAHHPHLAAAALRVPNCGERHTEDHPEIEGTLTRRLARELVRDAKHLTIRELSRRHRLSWHLIMGCGTGRLGWAPTDVRCPVGCCWWTRPRCAGATATSPCCSTATRARCWAWSATATPPL
ncbi:MAG TPA: hypothetical protein VK988_07980 [Acidimicrobiales bacterium]|nr:hypothetical protein [Acidimicrobiales bacterium]